MEDFKIADVILCDIQSYDTKLLEGLVTNFFVGEKYPL